MAYVQRENGVIIGVFGLLQPDYAEEYLEDDAPEVVQFLTVKLTPLEQIRALEAQNADAQAKLNRQVALAVMLNTACAAPEAAGKSSAEVHDFLMATQPESGYARMYTLEQQVEALRAQL
jgi:hypothetical protein